MSTYKFKTTNIRGKQYVEVNERIKFFRQEDQYKGWGINNEFPMLTTEEALCRCTITDRDGMVVAVGHAHENRSASNINKTSYVENCETSAVGRALAMLGIGIDASIASANEVETAIAQEDSKTAGAGENFSHPAAANPKAPAKKAPAKKAPAKKVVAKKVEVEKPQGDLMENCVNYLKGQADKRKAFDAIIAKHGENLSDAQQSGLFKFVR